MESPGRQRIRVIFLTRFSFFGVSGWRSDTSQDPAVLLDAERLKGRFELFKAITVPSLAAQTDLDFDWIVLSSDAMRTEDKRALRRAVRSAGSEGSCKCLFREKGHAGNAFRAAIRRNYDSDVVACTVVLDDDDALCADFVARIKGLALEAWQGLPPDEDHALLSFPNGLSLKVGEGKAELFDRTVPFTNLGLCLIAEAQSRRNLFFMSHKRVGKRRNAKLIETEDPVYIRTVHASNDSRAMLGKDPVPASWETARRLFPGLDFSAFDTLGQGGDAG